MKRVCMQFRFPFPSLYSIRLSFKKSHLLDITSTIIAAIILFGIIPTIVVRAPVERIPLKCFLSSFSKMQQKKEKQMKYQLHLQSILNC